MSVVAPPIAAPEPLIERAGLLAQVHEWVVTVDHKRLGVMYVVAGLAFFLIAGLEASVIRWQLAAAGNTVVSPQVFNRLFTVHGTTMVFLVGIPIVFGFANYLVPLMIGARDLAFPRLNAFGFWAFLFGGALLYFSFLGGDGLYGAGSARDLHQSHRHDPHDAVPRDEPRAHAPLCLADARGLWHGGPGPAAAVRRPDHAAPGSLPRRSLLRHPGRGLRGHVAALLLVLRPPRGLHLDGPGLRHGLRDHPRLLATGDLRLPDGG